MPLKLHAMITGVQSMDLRLNNIKIQDNVNTVPVHRLKDIHRTRRLSQPVD